MDNYDKIVFVIENRGWKNGKLAEFIKTSKEKLNEDLVDEKVLKKLNELQDCQPCTEALGYFCG